MPVPEMGWQVAEPGHWSSSAVGLQTRAHWVGCWEPEVSRTHSPWALPDGLAGHLFLKMPVHLGEQKDPLTPVIWTASSSAAHPPELGSSYGPPDGPGGGGDGPGGVGGVGGVGPGDPAIGYDGCLRTPHSPDSPPAVLES